MNRRRSTLVVAAGLLPCICGWSGADSPPAAGHRTLADIRGAELTPPPAAPPNNPAVDQLLSEGRRLREEGEIITARLLLVRAVALPGGERFDVFSELAKCTSEDADDQSESAQWATRAAQARPNAPQAHFQLGQALAVVDRHQEAVAHFRAATILGERQLNDAYATASWFRLAEELQASGEFHAAAEAYARFDEAIWSVSPEHRHAAPVEELIAACPHGTLDRQLALWRQLGDSKAALHAARRSVELMPGDPGPAAAYVDALLDSGQASEAFEYAARRLQSWQPTSQAAAADYGSAYFKPALRAARVAGRLDLWLTQICEKLGAGANPALARALALRLDEDGDYSASSRIWMALAGRSDSDPEIVRRSVIALALSGKADAAVESLAEFCRVRPYETEIAAEAMTCPDGKASRTFDRTVLAACAGRSSDDRPTSIARLLLARFVGAQPVGEPPTEAADQSAQAWLAQAADDLARGRWEAALVAADAALKLAPRSAAACYARGQALQALDEQERAIGAYRDAARLAPDNPLYPYQLGRTYLLRGGDDLVSAQRYFQQAVDCDPRRIECIESLVESYLAASPPKSELAQMAVQRAENCELPAHVLRRLRTRLTYAEPDERWSDAHLETLAEAWASNPTDLIGGLLLVEGRLQRGEADQALMVTTALRQVSPNDEQVLRLSIRTHAANLDFAEAVEEQRTLQSRYPQRLAETTELALRLLHDFRVEEGLGVLAALERRDLSAERRLAARAIRLNACQAWQRFDEALQLVDQWSAEPGGEGWRIERIRVLARADRADAALSAMDELLRAQPTNRGIWLLALQICREVRRYDHAINWIRGWLRGPGSSQEEGLREQLITLLLLAKRHEEAMQEVERWVADWRGELNEPAWLLERSARRGGCLVAMGRTDEALADWDELLTREPFAGNSDERRAAQVRLISVLMDQRAYTAALERMEKWKPAPEQGQDELSEWTLQQMQLFQAVGRTDEYTAIAERLLDRGPNDPGLNNDLGYTWADQGLNLDRSLRMVRSALAASPLNAAYLDSLGWVYYKRGEMESARHFLDRAIQLIDGQDPVLYDHAADAAARAGDLAVAGRHWEKALELANQAADRWAVANGDETFLPRVRQKLAAMEKGEAPRVAPLGDARP